MNIDLLIRNLKSSLSLLFLAFFAISPSIQAEIEEGPLAPPLFDGETLVEIHVIGLSHLQQTKDTNMLCLDGCPEHGDFPWNGPHPTGTDMSGGHKSHGCARACLAMIASQTCKLSQDRIAYYIFEELNGSSASDMGNVGNPLGDLGHGRYTRGSDTRLTLDWIYGSAPGASTASHISIEIVNDLDPSDMDSIRDFIFDSRPVILRIEREEDDNSHSVIIDGYALVRREDDSGVTHDTSFLRILDPWRVDDISWKPVFTPEGIAAHSVVFPPQSGRPSRCDEPEITRDSDGDLIVDFDEIKRFQTNPNDPDSDHDFLRDDNDMRGYLFNLDGSYNLRDRDIDGDDLAKELDADNDRANNEGIIDGCEDANRNGFFDSGGRETDNFDSNDDGDILNPRCTYGFFRFENSGSLHGGITIESNEEISVNTPSAGAADYPYDHEWTTRGTVALAGATGHSSGHARTKAKVALELLDNGRYRLITDTNPKEGSYTSTITMMGRTTTKTYEMPFAFADVHYDYESSEVPAEFREWRDGEWGKPNVFEGEIEVMPDGRRRLSGQDTIALPPRFSGGGTLRGTATRTWEFWLATPQSE